MREPGKIGAAPSGRRFVVLGADGMLGRALVEELERLGEDAVATTISDLDVTDGRAVERFFEKARPGVVLNATGYTQVDGAETDPRAAELVNSRAPGLLAGSAARRDALFVHVSTDYVFDGSKSTPYTEDDPAGPGAALSVYGRTKLAGEEAVRASGARHLVVRTAWMFAPWGENFVLKIARLARERGELSVVDDQRGSPTYAPDLAGAMVELALAGSSGKIGGTFNVVNSGEATWCELAREVVRLAGLDAEIRPILTSEYGARASRPAYSVLATAKLGRTLGRVLRHWKDALAECMARSLPTGA